MAVYTVPEKRFCRDSTTLPPGIRNFLKNGIIGKTVLTRQKSQGLRTVGSGGSTRRDMNGWLLWRTEPPGTAARTVPDVRSLVASTTWQAVIRKSPLNGTMRKTETSARQRSHPVQTDLYGGAAGQDIPGGRRWQAAQAETAALTAETGRSGRGLTTFSHACLKLRVSGTSRKTAG